MYLNTKAHTVLTVLTVQSEASNNGHEWCVQRLQPVFIANRKYFHQKGHHNGFDSNRTRQGFEQCLFFHFSSSHSPLAGWFGGWEAGEGFQGWVSVVRVVGAAFYFPSQVSLSLWGAGGEWRWK